MKIRDHFIRMIGGKIKICAIWFAFKSPYLWFQMYKLANTFSFLLPYDTAYWGLKHFCYLKDDFFLDVGANSGMSALSFRKVSGKLGVNIPILSLEPNPLHQSNLSKLHKKIPNFSFLMLGAGNINADVSFFTPVYSDVPLHVFTSTNKALMSTWFEKMFGKKVSNSPNLVVREIVAKITRIDDLSIEPTIIKIDTEGSDYQVLLGAQNTIQKMRPFIMIEVSLNTYKEIAIFFQENNYRLFNYVYENDSFIPVNEKKLSKMTVGGNIFALPTEKIAQIYR